MRAHLLAGNTANQLIYPQVGVTATTVSYTHLTLPTNREV